MEFSTFEAFILAAGALGFGMVVLIRGGGWTVDSSVFIAEKFGLSKLLVGFTIVAFGTSLPELIVSINANLKGSPGITLGNVVGSNIANILFVIGATALFAPLFVDKAKLWRDLVMMNLATVLLGGLLLYGQIGTVAGILMIVILLSYILWKYRMATSGAIPVALDDDDGDHAISFPNVPAALGFLLAGLVFVALGAEFLVRGASVCAEILGVPEEVVGLSVIAFGTSLPELSTCIIAAMRKHSDIVLGNVVGSNLFNILMIIGLTSIVAPFGEGSITPQIAYIDMAVLSGVSLLFTAILLLHGKIGKPLGIVLCLAYVAYIGAIYALFLDPQAVAAIAKP